MRRVLVFTSGRSDYGILRPVIRRFISDDDLDAAVFVTGSHLESSHGRTITEIENDDVPIAAAISIIGGGDDWQATALMTSRSIEASATVLQEWRPDVAIVLGDRCEALGFAIACHLSRTPLVHLHGGEVTVGAVDDANRHAITKFASLHLAAAQQFADRIAQLGEDPSIIHVVGAPGLDSILEDRAALESGPRSTGRLLVTYHAATLADEDPAEAMEAILAGCLKGSNDEIVVTTPNADHGGRRIRDTIDKVASVHAARIRVVDALGTTGFHRETYGASALVGNSSAGLIEAPFLGTPTINVGDRQRGRPRADGVIDVAPDQDSIAEALSLARRLEPRLVPFLPTVYGDGHAALRIVELVKSMKLETTKTFHDLEGRG